MVLDNPSCVNRCLFIAKVSNGQISDSTTHVTLSKSWLHAVITNYFSHTYGYLQPSAFGKNMLLYSVIFSLLDKSQDEPENEDKPTELAVKEDEKSMNISCNSLTQNTYNFFAILQILASTSIWNSRVVIWASFPVWVLQPANWHVKSWKIAHFSPSIK